MKVKAAGQQLLPPSKDRRARPRPYASVPASSAGRPLRHIGLRAARQALHELAEVPQKVISQQPTGLARLAQPLIELRQII